MMTFLKKNISFYDDNTWHVGPTNSILQGPPTTESTRIFISTN